MRIVEQFVKVLVSIMTARKAGHHEEARKEIQMASRFYLKMDIEHLSLFSPEQLAAYFTELNGKLDAERAVFCADLLYETALIAEARGEDAPGLKRLSLHLYSAAVAADPQFRIPLYLDRINSLNV